MMREAIHVAELLAAMGAGLASGVYFAFSAFVMQGLKRLPAEDGIKAMNAINVAAVRPPLMVLLFGTAAMCLAVVVSLVVTWGSPTTRLAESGMTMSLAGAVVYILGAVLVTMERNVPLNRALAAATDASGRDDMEGLSARLGEVESCPDGDLRRRVRSAHFRRGASVGEAVDGATRHIRLHDARWSNGPLLAARLPGMQPGTGPQPELRQVDHPAERLPAEDVHVVMRHFLVAVRRRYWRSGDSRLGDARSWVILEMARDMAAISASLALAPKSWPPIDRRPWGSPAHAPWPGGGYR